MIEGQEGLGNHNYHLFISIPCFNSWKAWHKINKTKIYRKTTPMTPFLSNFLPWSLFSWSWCFVYYFNISSLLCFSLYYVNILIITSWVLPPAWCLATWQSVGWTFLNNPSHFSPTFRPSCQLQNLPSPIGGETRERETGWVGKKVNRNGDDIIY